MRVSYVFMKQSLSDILVFSREQFSVSPSEMSVIHFSAPSTILLDIIFSEYAAIPSREYVLSNDYESIILIFVIYNCLQTFNHYF